MCYCQTDDFSNLFSLEIDCSILGTLMTFFTSMLMKSIKLPKTEKGQPIKLDCAILEKLLPFLFAGCIRQSVIGL